MAATKDPNLLVSARTMMFLFVFPRSESSIFIALLRWFQGSRCLLIEVYRIKEVKALEPSDIYLEVIEFKQNEGSISVLIAATSDAGEVLVTLARRKSLDVFKKRNLFLRGDTSPHRFQVSRLKGFNNGSTFVWWRRRRRIGLSLEELCVFVCGVLGSLTSLVILLYITLHYLTTYFTLRHWRVLSTVCYKRCQ